MLRRLAPLCALALTATAFAGCGAAPTGPQKVRVDFLKAHQNLKDVQLAIVCPSLYPSDFLRKPDKYHYAKGDRAYKPTARERADAKAAGCTSQGTVPKK